MSSTTSNPALDTIRLVTGGAMALSVTGVGLLGLHLAQDHQAVLAAASAPIGSSSTFGGQGGLTPGFSDDSGQQDGPFGQAGQPGLQSGGFGSVSPLGSGSGGAGSPGLITSGS